MKKGFKVLVSLVMSAILTMGLMSTAFAEGSIVQGSEEAPAQVAITKVLKMGESTDTPAATFKFSVAKKSLDAASSTTVLATMPEIGEQTVTFAATDEGTTADHIKTVPKETENILNGITWPHAGVYAYTITEQADTYAIADAAKESLTYSPAEYEMQVYVSNTEDGTGLYVSAIAVIIRVKDTEEQGEVGDKVDPTPDGDPDVDGDYSQMTFTNTYIKTNGGGGDPEDPTNHVLSISKKVSGSLANKDMYFDYSMTATKTPLITTTPVYKGYVVNAENTVVTATENAANAEAVKTDDSGKKYIEFTSGTATVFKLKHDQKLVFTDIEVGAMYSATETGVAAYTPSAKITVNGIVVTPDLTAGAGENLATGDRVLGGAANIAAYTNAMQDTTPTGIILNNLPFVILIAVAVAAILLYTVMETRKRVKSGK